MNIAFPFVPRRGVVLLLALVAMVALAACGDDDDNGDGSPAATMEPTATAAPTEEPTTAPTEAPTEEPTPVVREIDHEVGTTSISGVPERIVVLEYSFADNLGTLGIVPVGFAVDAPPAYLAEYTEDAGATPVGTRAEPNLEVIVGLDPDLIIGDLRRHEEIYSQLSEIAPTLIFNSLRGSYQDQLDTFAVIAEILGKESEAADLLASYQTTFDGAQSQTNAEAGPFMIGVLHSGGYTAHSNQSFMGSFLEGLNRTNALEPQGEETQYLLDLEGMASVNPSTIVVLCNPGDGELLTDLSSAPVWQALEAVNNDRVYVFDRNLWSKGRGVLAYERIIADAVDSGLLADEPSNRTSCD